MKIKVVHRSEPPNQERVSIPYPDMPKKEVFDEEQENQQLGTQEPEPEPDFAIPKMGDDNLSLVDASIPINSITPSTQTPISSLLGKRRRKPKEMVDQISTIPFRKKRVFKKQSQSSNGVAVAGCRSISTKLERATADGSGSATQMKSPIIIRAEEFLLSIGNEYPSFMKLLVRSHVGSCFWMGLPVPFCKNHLPRKDTPVILESETGEEFEIKYIAEKTGLSAGWRKYAAAHKLVEGDVLVFQLVEPTRFKVYVIRANDLKEVDGALSLLNLDAPAKQSDAEGAIGNNIKKRQKKSLPLTVVQKRRRKEDLSKQLVPLEAQSGNDSDEVASEILEGSRSSGLAVNFRDIKSLEEFQILVNGVCIDSELPEHIRRKYYELCCSKNAFLHDRLLQGLHCKLVAGMIFEVVNIADMVRACKLSTPRKEFDKWEKSLKSFELLGMNVGFLRTRLRWLLSLAFDSEGASDTKRYWDAKKEWSRAEDEIRNLEMKLEELKQASGKYVADVEALKSKAESYELMFQGEVNAPW
ncbi:B3 domain-containing protein Os01g0234100 [Solanum lycopersicum]|uniref:TF-B3 domain-containing protein n=1 Tax=Solanum lycopersicum TaxID=4081 RepID=A0A3Q7FY77_SOLLC|nr:B3 domain-containing protein Os01g0234100 [Solanum lycopersicum]